MCRNRFCTLSLSGYRISWQCLAYSFSMNTFRCYCFYCLHWDLLDNFSSHYQPLRNSITDICLCMLYVQMYVCFIWETHKYFFKKILFYRHKLFIVFSFILIFISGFPFLFPPITVFFPFSHLGATPLEKMIHAPLADVNSCSLFR